jgi:hypothetical protein
MSMIGIHMESAVMPVHPVVMVLAVTVFQQVDIPQDVGIFHVA